jgi:hypothetical protein
MHVLLELGAFVCRRLSWACGHETDMAQHCKRDEQGRRPLQQRADMRRLLHGREPVLWLADLVRPEDRPVSWAAKLTCNCHDIGSSPAPADEQHEALQAGGSAKISQIVDAQRPY